MQSKSQARFADVERQRAELLDGVTALSDAQLDWKANADAWNVRQMVEHLVLSDETVGQVRDAQTMPAVAPMFRVLPRALRRTLVLRALERDMTLPLPGAEFAPSGNVPLPELLARWDRARDAMRRGLDALQDDAAHYWHPVLGPLTALQMLQLEHTHTAYHARQIQATQRSAAFLGAATA